MKHLDIALGLVAAAVLLACDPSTTDGDQDQKRTAGGETTSQGKEVTKAVCVLRGTAGNEGVQGVVVFTKQGEGVKVEANVSGLSPGEHGFHVHALGDINCDDGKCTGDHFNPTNEKHGGPDSEERHAGDLGNISVGDDGKGTYNRVDRVVKLNGPHSVIGRAMIVHAGRDDLTSQPSGDAGARLAYGVIGIAEEK